MFWLSFWFEWMASLEMLLNSQWRQGDQRKYALPKIKTWWKPQISSRRMFECYAGVYVGKVTLKPFFAYACVTLSNIRRQSLPIVFASLSSDASERHSFDVALLDDASDSSAISSSLELRLRFCPRDPRRHRESFARDSRSFASPSAAVFSPPDPSSSENCMGLSSPTFCLRASTRFNSSSAFVVDKINNYNWVYLLEVSKNVWNLLQKPLHPLRSSHAYSKGVSTNLWCFGKKHHKIHIATLQALLQSDVFLFGAFAPRFWTLIQATCSRERGIGTKTHCDFGNACPAENRFWILFHILYAGTCAWLMTVVLANNSRRSLASTTHAQFNLIDLNWIWSFGYLLHMNATHKGIDSASKSE